MPLSRPDAAALVLLVCAPVLLAAGPVLAQRAPAVPAQPASRTDSAMLAHAERLLDRVPVIDGHNDLASELLERFGGDLSRAGLARGQPALQTDLPRLRAGHVGAQFWSAYVDNDSIPTGASLRVALRQIDMIHRLVAAYPGVLQPARTAAEIEDAERNGRIASLIGVEGGQAIEGSLSALRMLYDLGVRYMTLTHNTTLPWADAALDSARHHGLTPFGIEVVHEMNRLGMFVDLAHVSDSVMVQAMRASRAPVIFSHSSARALIDSPRNVPDPILRQLAQNGGVVMVNFCPCFTAHGAPEWEAARDRMLAAARASGAGRADVGAALRAWTAEHPQPRATVSDIADHIDHLVKVAGIDHVGIGSDFDGIGGSAPLGLPDVSSYPVLFAELIRRGYPDADLEKIAGLNLLRAMKQMEAVAARLQRTQAPSLADVEGGTDAR